MSSNIHLMTYNIQLMPLKHPFVVYVVLNHSSPMCYDGCVVLRPGLYKGLHISC